MLSLGCRGLMSRPPPTLMDGGSGIISTLGLALAGIPRTRTHQECARPLRAKEHDLAKRFGRRSGLRRWCAGVMIETGEQTGGNPGRNASPAHRSESACRDKRAVRRQQQEGGLDPT